MVPLIRLDVREANSANEVLREDRVDTLRDTRQLGDGASRSNRPSLHRSRNSELVSEVLSSYLNDIRHLLQESGELIAVGSLRILDPSHSEERSNSEVSHSDPPVPSKHSRLLRVIHVTVGGAHEEPSHQLVRTAHAVNVDLALVIDKSRQVDVSEVAVLPRFQCDFTARVSGNNLIRLTDIGVGRVPESRLSIGQHSLGDHLENFSRVRLSVLDRFPELVIHLH